MITLQAEVAHIWFYVYICDSSPFFSWQYEQQKSHGIRSFQFWFRALSYLILIQVICFAVQPQSGQSYQNLHKFFITCLSAVSYCKILVERKVAVDIMKFWMKSVGNHSHHNPTTSGFNSASTHSSVQNLRAAAPQKATIKYLCVYEMFVIVFLHMQVSSGRWQFKLEFDIGYNERLMWTNKKTIRLEQ